MALEQGIIAKTSASGYVNLFGRRLRASRAPDVKALFRELTGGLDSKQLCSSMAG
jgi:hypothetical protein